MMTNRRANGGFTLLEVVVTLTIAAVLATVLLLLFGHGVRRAAEPAARLAGVYRLQTVMENIRHDAVSNSLVMVSARVGPEGSEADNGYGRYRVVNNRFIALDGGVEVAAPGTTNVLKVTIADADGARLALLLSR
jgi:prepilin-type N-terminal cleavage/methylation domain-containing protein